MNQIVKNLVEIRKKNNVSQEEIADKYGISQKAVSRLENGKRKIEIDYLAFYSNYFDMTIDQIVNYDLNDNGIKSQTLAENRVEYSSKRVKEIEKMFTEQIETYREALDNKNQVIDLLREQKEFYKKAFEECEKKIVSKSSL